MPQETRLNYNKNGPSKEYLSVNAFLTHNVIFLEKPSQRHKWSLFKILGW